jgi:hypothetical protein
MRNILFSVLALLVLTAAGFATASEAPAEAQPTAPVAEEAATPDETASPEVEVTPEWLRNMQQQSTTITCYVQCGDGSTDSGTCVNTTLSECCGWSHVYGCRWNGGYVSGYCTDGSSSLTC